MLGSVAEAEDIVQEALLRFVEAERKGVVPQSPRAWLTAVATRIAIDHLRSARVRREAYVGTWLPEPLVQEKHGGAQGKAEAAEFISMAFLAMCETLSPIERAVFLLREAFDYGYDEIAEIVEKSAENCRQLFTRARRRMEEGKPRFETSREKRDEIAARFLEACQAGALEPLERLLAADAVFYGDGGGKTAAVMHPICGRNRVARLIAGLFTKGRAARIQVQAVDVNGDPGARILDAAGRLISIMSFDVAESGVVAIRSVVNPDKLGHLGEISELTRTPAGDRAG